MIYLDKDHVWDLVKQTIMDQESPIGKKLKSQMDHDQWMREHALIHFKLPRVTGHTTAAIHVQQNLCRQGVYDSVLLRYEAGPCFSVKHPKGHRFEESDYKDWSGSGKPSFLWSRGLRSQIFLVDNYTIIPPYLIKPLWDEMILCSVMQYPPDTTFLYVLFG